MSVQEDMGETKMTAPVRGAENTGPVGQICGLHWTRSFSCKERFRGSQ